MEKSSLRKFAKIRTFIKNITIHLDDLFFCQLQLDLREPTQNSDFSSVLLKVGDARDGNMKLCKNGKNRNIQLSLGLYSVILKYLHDHISYILKECYKLNGFEKKRS
jgi:hypothetical protein